MIVFVLAFFRRRARKHLLPVVTRVCFCCFLNLRSALRMCSGQLHRQRDTGSSRLVSDVTDCAFRGVCLLRGAWCVCVLQMNGAWPKWHMTDFGGAILVFVGALVFHFKEVRVHLVCVHSLRLALSIQATTQYCLACSRCVAFIHPCPVSVFVNGACVGRWSLGFVRMPQEPGSQAETPLPHMPGDSGHKGGKHHGKSGSSGGAASSSTSSSDSDGVSPWFVEGACCVSFTL